MNQAGRWAHSVQILARLMEALSVLASDGSELGEAGFRLWAQRTLEVGASRGCVFFAGNGASASMASHFSADLGKNARVRTSVFTDPALMTAVANDLCYAEVFAEPLSWSLRPGDMLVLVSSSGNSPNVLRAAERARDLGGQVVTLSAMSPVNALRRLGDINFYVPAQTYGQAEVAHSAILHHWVDSVVEICQGREATSPTVCEP